MNADGIRTWYYARPFKPFELLLSDERRLKVPEPNGLGFPPDGKHLDYVHDDERFELIPFTDIVEIRELKGKRKSLRGHRKAS